ADRRASAAIADRVLLWSQASAVAGAASAGVESIALSQPNPGLPGFGHFKLAGSGQARSRLGEGISNSATKRMGEGTPHPIEIVARVSLPSPVRGEGDAFHSAFVARLILASVL